MPKTATRGPSKKGPKLKSSEYLFLITLAFTTVAVNPWTNIDPINQPKLLVLLLGLSVLIPSLVSNLIKLQILKDYFILYVLALALIYLASAFFRERSPWIYLWGIYGRATGSLAYVALLTVAMYAYLNREMLQIALLLKWFIRTGYVVTGYAILQFADLDPIGWETRGQVGFSTLGNINFTSSFIGLTSVAMIGRAANTEKALPAKVWYLFVSFINALIIYGSGSLQGFVTILTGIALLFLLRLFNSNFSIFRAAGATLLFVSGWVLSFIGLYGKGPLGALLRQETMLFRLDYWDAGISMIRNFPWRGLGPDAYGSFYREFRSNEATYRTDPSRFSDSAHNVLIDIGVSVGVIGLLVFIGILFLTFLRSLRTIIKNSKKEADLGEFNIILVLFIVFALQLIYSINQIGVTVWGMAFMGLLARRDFNFEKEQSTPDKKVSAVKWMQAEPKSDSRTFHFYFSMVLSGLLVTLVILPRSVNDFNFKAAFSRGDFSELTRLSLDPVLPDGWGNLVLDRAVAEGRRSDSLPLARNLVLKNERNFYAWSIIFRHEDSTSIERARALEQMKRLDPQNLALQDQLP